MQSFFWHDYETWGTDPRVDRVAQFAGVRTDLEFNVIEPEVNLYCRPADDVLPHPQACLVTGITPQQSRLEGLPEAEFFRHINELLSLPGTCGVGYNSIRFDDEFSRFGFYRNFIDPYAREWQNGNSRWDIIDMVRMARALRPEGIEWPTDEAGVTSFRLEKLTRANGLAHEAAHDALSDVYATIGMARLVREKQPRLFSYLLQLRDKRKVAALLNLRQQNPVLHVSSMFPAHLGCLSMVVPVCRHPGNSNGIIVYDLRYDPSALIELDPEEIRERLFTPRDLLPDGVERIALKTVHVNKSPALAPLDTLTGEMAEQWQLNRQQAEAFLTRIKAAPGVSQKVTEVFSQSNYDPMPDVDAGLYSGGFFSDADRRQIEAVQRAEPQQLKESAWVFEDERLPEMLFRYRARSWPETLSGDERERWNELRRSWFAGESARSGITLSEYRQQLARMMIDPDLSERDRSILSALADWPREIDC